jgi:hypothetical protein
MGSFNMKNIDQQTVKSFGDEWSRFDQSGMSNDESRKRFNEYFAVFPWDTLPSGLVNVRFSVAAPYWCMVGNKDKSCADSQVS